MINFFNAGAGSGKTYLLSEELSKFLLVYQPAEYKNQNCIFFSEKQGSMLRFSVPGTSDRWVTMNFIRKVKVLYNNIRECNYYPKTCHYYTKVANILSLKKNRRKKR